MASPCHLLHVSMSFPSDPWTSTFAYLTGSSGLPATIDTDPLAPTIPIHHQVQSTQPQNLSNQSSTHLHCHLQPKPPLPLTWKAATTPKSLLLVLESVLHSAASMRF